MITGSSRNQGPSPRGGVEHEAPERDTGHKEGEPPAGGAALQEQRFRSYHEKVRSAISFSAKKKQKEQEDILR